MLRKPEMLARSAVLGILLACTYTGVLSIGIRLFFVFKKPKVFYV